MKTKLERLLNFECPFFTKVVIKIYIIAGKTAEALCGCFLIFRKRLLVNLKV